LFKIVLLRDKKCILAGICLIFVEDASKSAFRIAGTMHLEEAIIKQRCQPFRKFTESNSYALLFLNLGIWFSIHDSL